VTTFSRFRDFVGDYPIHCHNTVHEDHAMMLLFQVQPNVIRQQSESLTQRQRNKRTLKGAKTMKGMTRRKWLVAAGATAALAGTTDLFGRTNQ
jgi:hypothetical protein